MGMTKAWRLTLLAALALLCMGAFMTLRVQSDWGFILEYRGPRLAAMLLVAWAIGLSTVLFQTITQNRVLTPALMGFDVLFILVQALAMLIWGASQWRELALPLRFSLEVLAVVLLALLVFRLLFSGAVRSLHLLILVGMLGGILFRELTEVLLRVLDPGVLAIDRGRSAASFNRINLGLLGVASLFVLVASGYLLWVLRRLDVLALGRDMALNLGLDYQPQVLRLLVVIAVMVAAATALVGPTLFFGLLVANLAYWLMGSQQHRWTLPASVLSGVVCLVGGQVLLEHVLVSSLPLSGVVELVGGLLLMRGVRQ
ncbi:MAG: iron chelate uptake ABC transporter family permease subunit [Pseudomonas sp.]